MNSLYQSIGKYLLCLLLPGILGGGYNRVFSKETTSTPRFISVIKGKTLTPDELVYVASLQGVTAKTVPQIYIDIHEYGFWIPELERTGCRMVEANLKSLTRQYLSEAKGYVLATLGNVSVAATVAGPLSAVVLTESMLDKYNEFKNLEMLMDLRDKDEVWLLNYVRTHLDLYCRDGILQYNPQRPHTLVDYAIATNRICIYGGGNPGLVRAFYGMIRPNTPRLGWGAPYGKENQDVGLAAEYGLYTLPASNSLNLSLLDGMKAETPKWKPNVAEVPERKNVHYVMLMMSDGDNLNWCMGGLAINDKYMSNPNAAGKSINWMFPPKLHSFIPVMYRYYRENLPRKNYLMGAVSGLGYTYPSLQKNLDDYAVASGRALKDSGLDYCVIMDQEDFFTTEKSLLKRMIKRMPDTKGFFYMDYGNYAKWNGAWYTVAGKPVVSFRYRLWLPKDPLEVVAAKINAASRDIHSIDAYSAVVVHVWSYGIDDVVRFINLLDDDVVLVNGAQFMDLIVKNVKR